MIGNFYPGKQAVSEIEMLKLHKKIKKNRNLLTNTTKRSILFLQLGLGFYQAGSDLGKYLRKVISMQLEVLGIGNFFSPGCVDIGVRTQRFTEKQIVDWGR